MPLRSWAELAEEAGDTGFTAIPEGDYDLKIESAEAKQTGNQKTMFKLTSVITSGPYAKRKIWANLVVSPENPVALNIFFRQMAAIGIAKEYFATNPSDSNVAEALVGKEFRGQVVIKQWQGEDRNEIRNYSRLNRTETSSTGPAPTAAQPSPTNAPPAPAGMAPAPSPAAAPPAAAEKTAEADTSAVETVTQPETPAVADTPPPAADSAPTPEPAAAPASVSTSSDVPEPPF
ncbi:hypothetical protein SEA_FORZA_166 [Gordonia phage Forza]|uniref:DUF669 domain-containing protein n=1 Tax=Gordonia phage Forza TaxID=2571247 RepID=A0A650EY83_9CAUD|nr:hypothetical protein PP303_gp162 [Gordonia phage Forza]QEM41601.1 hypothetical protein SEA_BOOPY_165 [Gordonia phage Boopy]QGT55127.1 hypothetical protein SEA_FORZA_166 [Gordonia phage Forza]UXE04275.1 hypothetical protein SEA_BLUENGOLD_162 [Gordonia phage BlueNGold]WBF03916.1 hypothetical protein SEA_MAREELIH_163 [Gordonia phage Mareelih]